MPATSFVLHTNNQLYFHSFSVFLSIFFTTRDFLEHPQRELKFANLVLDVLQRIKLNQQIYLYMVEVKQTYHITKFYSYDFRKTV